MPHRRTTATLAVAGTLLTVPVAAEAASVAAPSCGRVVPGQPTIPVSGSGFTPGSPVTFRTADGQTLGTAVADAAGNAAVTVPGPNLPADVERRSLQLVGSDAAGLVSPAAPFDVVKITATLPDRARPGSRVRIRAYGFQTGRTVYLHVRRSGRTRGSFRISRARGACGIASRRLRYMPLRRYSTGAYDYIFQHTRRFDPSEPGVRLRISIIRRAA
jgi:hypothetical protein